MPKIKIYDHLIRIIDFDQPLPRLFQDVRFQNQLRQRQKEHLWVLNAHSKAGFISIQSAELDAAVRPIQK